VPQTSINYLHASFGGSVRGSNTPRRILPLHVDDAASLGCSPLMPATENGVSYNGSILLIKRGICSMGTKALHGSLVGAAGVIIANCPGTEGCPSGLTVINDAQAVSSFVLFIDECDAAFLAEQLRNSSQVVTAHVPGTDASGMIPSERAVMALIAQRHSFGFYNQGHVRSW
jgi:hypothetical protein